MFSSLNLSHAVSIIAYEIMCSKKTTQGNEMNAKKSNDIRATKNELIIAAKPWEAGIEKLLKESNKVKNPAPLIIGIAIKNVLSSHLVNEIIVVLSKSVCDLYLIAIVKAPLEKQNNCLL